MSCEQCKDITEQSPDLPYIVRECEKCGRELILTPDPGPHGIGIEVKNAKRFVIPRTWMTQSLNPLRGNATLTRYGIHMYAERMHLEGILDKRDKIDEEIGRLQKQVDDTLMESPLLKDFDPDKPDDKDAFRELLGKHRETREAFAFLMGVYLAWLRDGIESNDVHLTAWATACVERCRAMVIFKEELEEVVWAGQSARRIINLLRTWDSHKNNDDEEFWQITFASNAYAISQLFAVPVLFIQGKAYIGGMAVDRTDARFVDYLFANESSREAIVVEIKTPVKGLLGASYRGIQKPSAELAGAIMQVLDYRQTLLQNLDILKDEQRKPFGGYAPKCILIIGNGQAELDSEEKRRVFELIRSNSRDVEIVTYDELFKKLEGLASLFHITRTSETPP